MEKIVRIINIVIIVLLAQFPFINACTNCSWGWYITLGVLYATINFWPNLAAIKIFHKRLRILRGGHELILLFGITTIINVLAGLYLLATTYYPAALYLLATLTIFAAEFFLFWNAFVRIFITSEQVKLKWRILTALLGWMPIINIPILIKLLRITDKEVRYEYSKYQLNLNRNEKKLCRTKYPILLVHGVFFRDYKYTNYWGRIPEELERNGATIFYGRQQSADSVANCGTDIAARILKICEECECEKVNIIAHSKGGLDSRYALSLPGIKEHVASLTTINTPHRGCKFADYLLRKLPKSQVDLIARTYNKTLRKLGDPAPDFMSAVKDLTYEHCTRFNEEIHDQEGVLYQSIGSLMENPVSGQFPLNFSYMICERHDGQNDGLVGEESFPWGESFRMLTTTEKRGISHGDVIDMNQENLAGFDVREFYVELVNGLKKRGM